MAVTSGLSTGNGNTTNKLNDYIEVEVWGKPA